MSFMTSVLASHRESGLMTHLRIRQGPLQEPKERYERRGWHAGLLSVQLDGGQSVGLKTESQLENHNTAGRRVQNVPFPVTRGGPAAMLEKPLVLIINDMSVCDVGPEKAYCSFAVT